MLDCLPFLKIGRWREENVRDCIAFTAWEGSSSVLAAAIPALPVPHQWGLRLFPGIFLLAFYYSFWSSSPHHLSTFSSVEHVAISGLCQLLVLEITSLESVLTLLVV